MTTVYTPPNLEEETKERIKELKDLLSGKIDLFGKKKKNLNLTKMLINLNYILKE